MNTVSRKNVLCLGNGFLGSTFRRHGYTVVGRDVFDWSTVMNAPVQTDSEIVDLFRKYDVVINCIAKSDTRWCENPVNFHELMSINAELPKYLSLKCSTTNTKLVHISTGCLYDSRGKGKSSEGDFLSAHCNYVVSKWAGERFLSHNDLILRPRLIFDSEPATGRNNLIQKLPQFTQFLDEFNSVTSTDTIVESVEALLDATQTGVFNICNTGTYTIYEIAEAIGLMGDKIKQEDLHTSQGLFLVNNVMDSAKLEEFYIPRNTIEEIKRCNEILQKTLASGV